MSRLENPGQGHKLEDAWQVCYTTNSEKKVCVIVDARSAAHLHVFGPLDTVDGPATITSISGMPPGSIETGKIVE